MIGPRILSPVRSILSSTLYTKQDQFFTRLDWRLSRRLNGKLFVLTDSKIYYSVSAPWERLEEDIE